jgi:hypothetical protein
MRACRAVTRLGVLFKSLAVERMRRAEAEAVGIDPNRDARAHEELEIGGYGVRRPCDRECKNAGDHQLRVCRAGTESQSTKG